MPKPPKEVSQSLEEQRTAVEMARIAVQVAAANLVGAAIEHASIPARLELVKAHRASIQALMDARLSALEGTDR